MYVYIYIYAQKKGSHEVSKDAPLEKVAFHVSPPPHSILVLLDGPV